MNDYDVDNGPPLVGMRAPLLYQRVKLHGLVSRPELNGSFGKAVSWSEEKGRYGVQIAGHEDMIALKPANLAAAGAEEGVVCGHCGAGAANERCTRCFAVGYCSAECRKQGWAAHKPACTPPPVAEFGSEMSHAQQAKIQQHMQAAIDAGKRGSAAGKAQEIKMLRQSAAADPQQPMTWFNLAQAYWDLGVKGDAVEAMCKAVHNLVRVLKNPQAVDLSDPNAKYLMEVLPPKVTATAAKLLEDAVVGRGGDQLEWDERLGRLLQTLADLCGSRLHPGARSLTHYVFGNVLRKRRKNEEAREQLVLADRAAWNGGRGERDLVSLSAIPDVIANQALDLGGAAPPELWVEAISAAREALGATPRNHRMHPSVQLTLARMLSNRISKGLADAQGHVNVDEAAPLAREGAKLARAARAAAQGSDPRLVALADQLLSPSQPFGLLAGA